MGVRRLFDIMKVIAAYMLAVTGGNATPNVADCKKILSAVGVNVTEDEEKRLEDLVEEMAGGSLEETLAKGHELLKTVPGGSGGGAAPAGEQPQPQVVRPLLRRRRAAPMMMMMQVWLALTSSAMMVVTTIKQQTFTSMPSRSFR